MHVRFLQSSTVGTSGASHPRQEDGLLLSATPCLGMRDSGICLRLQLSAEDPDVQGYGSFAPGGSDEIDVTIHRIKFVRYYS